MAREQWGTKAGFILAAVGSAIGLGNIVRYPYVAYENGGGAFLIPYFVALLTAGIPILIMEYAIGHKYRSSAPFGFRSMHKKWEWLGWWQALVAFFIASYYVVIVGWALSYTYYSFGTQWGDKPGDFFGSYLGEAEAFWGMSIQWKVLISVLIVWAVVYWVLQRGVKRGLEVANKVLMPLLVVMLIVIIIRAVTLPGAVDGLNVLFTPDFTALTKPGVWIAAYGQVFFSLSIAFAIMITYSSYLPKKTDLANSGLIAAFANSSFEFMAAIGVFGALGFLANVQNVPVGEVAKGGLGLAFGVFPEIINAFPIWNSLFGFLFFGAILFAGFTSLVSILEVCIAATREKFQLSRSTAVNWVVGSAFVLSLLYTTNGSKYLDIVDRFVNNFGVVLGGLLEVLLIAWFVKQLSNLQEHINTISYVRVSGWWTVSLKYITPLLLGVMTVLNFIEEIKTPYGDYPMSGLLAFGWGVIAIILIGAFIFRSLNKGTAKEGS